MSTLAWACWHCGGLGGWDIIVQSEPGTNTVEGQHVLDYAGYRMRMPQKCPVCEGRGVVPQGFHSGSWITASNNTGNDTCQACNGQGILWS